MDLISRGRQSPAHDVQIKELKLSAGFAQDSMVRKGYRSAADDL